MIKIYTVIWFSSVVLLQVMAFAKSTGVRPLAVANDLKSELARYTLRAYENRESTNIVQGLLFIPKPRGNKPLPMVVYIPGNGEIGDVSRHFRQRAIFERITSENFQEKYPCFLLALTPPSSAKTILGGMPGSPTRLQKALRDFVFDVCIIQKRPKVDMNRLYVTGFSYGGVGAYALAQHFPKDFAAVLPIAALPPLPEYFNKNNPGNWWHFHNEGDYANHSIDVQDVEKYAKLVNEAGGDFRIGTFPALGHDAWTKTWREDVVWDWMFSKSLNGQVKQLTKKGKGADLIPLSISFAKCTSSVPGIDRNHGPERVIDGLDATWYEPLKPFTKHDWWQVDLIKPIQGRFIVVSGDDKGNKLVKSAYVETSIDGIHWQRAGHFSKKNGVCSFTSHRNIRFLRIKSTTSKPQRLCIRRLKIILDGK